MDTKHWVSIGIILSCLVVVCITTSFAYFVASIEANNINELNFNTATVGSIKYDGQTTFDETEIYPGMKYVQTFTIEKGSQAGEGVYEIDLEGILPEEFKNDVTITLYKTTDPTTNSITRVEGELTQTSEGFVKEDTITVNGDPEKVYGPNIFTNSSEIVLEQAEFNTETLEKTTYYLVYEYNDNGNQNTQQGKTFSGKVTVKLIAGKQTFAEKVVDCSTKGKSGATCLLENAGLNTTELAYDETVDNNLRYIGANPNNYIDIGDKYPENFIINRWEEIGVDASSAEECNEFADSSFNCSNYGDLGFSTEEECNNELSTFLEEDYNVSSTEEFKSTYCVAEDISGQPILWRIIGVMNNIDDGTGKKETRLKIIRDEPIGEYSWDNKASGTGSSTSVYGSNDWSDSALQIVLNEGAYWNRTSGECPYGRDGATTSCDFSNIGLTEEAKSMIGDTKWNLGGRSTYTDLTASEFYERERGTDVYNERPTEWIGKIGLMYLSDYGYATSGGSTMNRETCLNTELFDWYDLSVSDCFNNDWLYDSSNYQWTLIPESSSSYFVLSVDKWSGLSDSTAYNMYPVRPTLYLSSNVKISGGEGTESSPFTLSL